MNQVIRIIFDDNVTKERTDKLFETVQKWLGNIAAIEVYEQEFTDEDNDDGKEQREKKSK